ncbi:MAG: hypothetical protein Q4C59_07310 [Lachnospiraceae bacterium]|nr:hypothetical protein [Lachnospiraceae bacterium]
MKNIVTIKLYDVNTPISDFTPSPDEIVGKRVFHLDKCLGISKNQQDADEFINLSDAGYFWIKFSDTDLKTVKRFLENLFACSYERLFMQYTIYQCDEYYYACYIFSTTPMALWKYIISFCIHFFQKLLLPLRFPLSKNIYRVISNADRSASPF